ncbi:oxidoreductase [Coccomyxa subellipsoidea C-169]|uniref:Oxidoreductase n=1 Tax=Coccomyxa subellipsoidea (strain C-169) TaxID=574566 RepID=I0YUK0_COCSC|nr:oxidoreductase [Coccomyxa subellipsoidea C-169]EIE22069.1 oxidoreductase [Coccomyxa subellipsoidea C-169]|eukprot:XP_005646613.1 oxidoreductase [Coccomyxa subellipsoidea C-169]
MGRPIVQVSLDDFENRKQEITNDLWKAATEIGFFYLKDHGLSGDEIKHMFEISEAFFKLPADVKAKYRFDLSKNIGWESGQQKRASHHLPELKESLQLKWHDMEGRWPSDQDIADFQATCEAFMQKCQEISFKVLSCFALGLGFEEDFFTKNHDVTKPDAQQTFRLMHYFPVEGKTFPEGFPRAGSHCDFETITLLFAKGAGLEVCPGREATSEHAVGDEWTECPALPGTITVNIGDALMRWSDDKLKSNYHRVRMPLPGEDKGSRFSIAYFNQANKHSIIEGKEGRYPPISAEEFVSESLRAIYVKQPQAVSAAS